MSFELLVVVWCEGLKSTSNFLWRTRVEAVSSVEGEGTPQVFK